MAVAGRRGRGGGGNNPAEAFYLNHSSAPFKSIWQVSPILIKRRIWRMTTPPPHLRTSRHERNVWACKYFMKEATIKNISSGYFSHCRAPWAIHPSHLPSVSIVISSQWSVGVHIPASSPQHQSATHSDRRHGLSRDQADTQYSPRIKRRGNT